MGRPYILIIICVISFTMSFGQRNPTCKIETNIGDITVELYQTAAENTVVNFLYYVENQLYDNSSFLSKLYFYKIPRSTTLYHLIYSGF